MEEDKIDLKKYQEEIINSADESKKIQTTGYNETARKTIFFIVGSVWALIFGTKKDNDNLGALYGTLIVSFIYLLIDTLRYFYGYYKCNKAGNDARKLYDKKYTQKDLDTIYGDLVGVNDCSSDWLWVQVVFYFVTIVLFVIGVVCVC